MSWIGLLGLVLVAAATIYVLRFGSYRQWRRGNRLHNDWQRERQQLVQSLQALQPPQPHEPPTSAVIEGEIVDDQADDDQRSGYR